MAELLTSQLDYVDFAFGLTLVLLGSVATSISRSDPDRLPWGWFAAFAYTHGIVEWLHLAERASGNDQALHVGVMVLLLGSCVLLFEFARRSHAVLRGAGPGRWLTWVAVAPPLAVALVWGVANLDDVVDSAAGAGEEHVAYLLDASGPTVAASNRGRPDSFLGKNHATRPYFQDAIGGAPGRFIGRGLTSGKAGSYASEPVRDAGGRSSASRW